MDPSAGSHVQAGARGSVRPPVELLDRTLLRMRRLLIRPDISTVPLPALDRAVDLSKVMACFAIEDFEAAGARSVTVKDVAAALILEHSTASRLLAEAEAEGLVQRGSDTVDRRRTTVTLTDAGRAVVRESIVIRTWALEHLLEAWDPADVSALAGLMERFCATLEDRSPDVLCEALDRFHRARSAARDAGDAPTR